MEDYTTREHRLDRRIRKQVKRDGENLLNIALFVAFVFAVTTFYQIYSLHMALVAWGI